MKNEKFKKFKRSLVFTSPNIKAIEQAQRGLNSALQVHISTVAAPSRNQIPSARGVTSMILSWRRPPLWGVFCLHIMLVKSSVFCFTTATQHWALKAAEMWVTYNKILCLKSSCIDMHGALLLLLC